MGIYKSDVLLSYASGDKKGKKKMSMIRYIVVFVLSLTGLLGCETRKNKKPPKKEELTFRPSTPIPDKKLMYTLMDSALATGDERVYRKVAGYYIIGGQEQEFFYCAFTMANKYNSAMAYYHVFLLIANSISGYPDLTLKKIDNKSRNFALYNLLKSYDSGHEHMRSHVEEFFWKEYAYSKVVNLS